MRSRFFVISVVLVLYAFGSIPCISSAEPVPKKDPIAAAVKKGTTFLLEQHRPDPQYQGGTHGIGTACLAGMALLESGIDEKNPSLHNIIKFVREGCLRETTTYHVSLCIMFLDRLGHRQDEGLIQFLGVRLMSGQTDAGGWSYDSSGYPLTAEAETRLRNAFAKEAKLTNVAPRPDAPSAPASKDRPRDDVPGEPVDPKPIPDKPNKQEARKPDRPVLHPEVGKLINEANPRKSGVLEPRFKGFPGMGFGGDNSNTQFAALGLWCARKHGVPIEKSMLALDERFRTSQWQDGSWSYGGRGPGTPSMTCAGLIALAVSFGTGDAVLKNKRDIAAPAPRKGGRVDLGEDEAIKNGLKRLGQYLTDAKGAPEEREPRRGRNRGLFPGDEALIGNLYFLWSLERVGVIYGLETIGKNDWYAWGSAGLLASQFADGSWSSSGLVGSSDIATPLALLFLHRANVARDLTAAIRGKVKDPGVSVLKSGGDLTKTLPNVKNNPPQEPAIQRPVKPAEDVATPDPKPVPANPVLEFEIRAARLAEGLINASGEQQTEIIRSLRDTKGAVYTEALTRAAGKMSGTAQSQVREALARRLARMTAATLREMLKDDERETRSAAAVACALKLDKQYVPDLIDALADKDTLVVRPAHAALRTLTGTDFGPASDADDAAKIKSILAWRSWWKTQPH